MRGVPLVRSRSFHRILTASLLFTCLLPVQPPVTASAQTVTTAITSSGLNTTVVPPQSGSTTTAIRGGTLSSSNANLFHSFGEFSIAQGETAAFQNLNAQGTAPLVNHASSVANIIGRVTGANPSSIYGTIDARTGFPSANLFLINPRGIVFGPGASFDVGGAVHFSTADYLRLGTGNEIFYADLSKNSTLSSEPVTAFGFLGLNPVGAQAIEMRNSASLTTSTGQDIALVGRDTVNGGEAVPGIRMDQGRITSPGGRISLVSVGAPLDPVAGGEVSATDFNPATASSGHGFATLGRIHMASNAFLNVGDSLGAASGDIVIRGGRLTMEEGARLLARTTDVNTLQGGIDIHVRGAMTLSGGSTIDSQVVGNAAIPGGDVVIRAGSLTVSEGSQITAINSSGHQNAVGGNIDITADTVTLSGAIDGGGNTVSSGLFSGTTRISSGAGGRIRVTSNELSILDGAAIDTSTFSGGHAGAIEIAAPTLLVSGVNTTNGITSPSSTISSRTTWDRQADNPNQEQQNTGNGGNIFIRTGSFDIRDGAQLTTSTETAGKAGTIDVVSDRIAIGGNRGVIKSGISARTELSGSSGGDGGTVSLTATTLSVTAGGAIELGTSGGGQGGRLVINAGEIAITQGGVISSESRGDGTAGSLSLSAQSFTITDAGSTLSTRTIGPGNGGTITLNADHAMLGSGSTIDSRTGSSFTRSDPTMQASGGSIAVSSGNTLHLQGGHITASSSGVGAAGTIQLSAGQVQLNGGAEVSSSTTGSGAGGTVTVSGGSVLINGGTIKATTSGSGSAGNIIVGGNTVSLAGAASSIDTSTGGTGNAGNIQIQAGHVTLMNNGTISSASVNPATGNAGSITIGATHQFQSTGGKVTTAADHGRGGDITIQSNEMLLNSGATISASTTGPFDAGSIALVAGDQIILQDSTVTTSASSASGGNITLLAPNLIQLDNGHIVSSVQGGPGTSGGDITIDPQAVLVQNNSQILAQAFQGNGGNISITAGVLIVDPSSRIDATSQLGVSGQVSLQAPIQNLAGVVMPLPGSFVNNANLYGQRCAAQKGGQFSSLVQGVRDGVPPQPGDFLSSPLPSNLSAIPPSVSEGNTLSTLMAIRLGFTGASLSETHRIVFSSGCRS